jgi:hypothetical protein
LSGDERERRESESERETWRSKFWLTAKIMVDLIIDMRSKKEENKYCVIHPIQKLCMAM